MTYWIQVNRHRISREYYFSSERLAMLREMLAKARALDCAITADAILERILTVQSLAKRERGIR
jgi:hypothetical protein